MDFLLKVKLVRVTLYPILNNNISSIFMSLLKYVENTCTLRLTRQKILAENISPTAILFSPIFLPAD